MPSADITVVIIEHEYLCECAYTAKSVQSAEVLTHLLTVSKYYDYYLYKFKF